MAGQINISMLLRFDAEAAKRAMAEATAAARGIGAAVAELGQKGAAAAPALTVIEGGVAGLGDKATAVTPALNAVGAAVTDVATKSTSAAPALAALGTAGTSAATALGSAGGALRVLASAAPEFSMQAGGTTTAVFGLQGAINGLTRDLSGQTAEMLLARRETATYRASLDELRARYNPLFAVSRQYEQQLREIADAERLGAISAGEAAAARTRAAAALAPEVNQYGQAVGASGGHTANLVAQFNDIGVMLAAGQNPLMLALQQGTQVSQVLNSLGGGVSPLKALGAGFLSMLNPISLATIAIIAFGAAGVQWLMSLGNQTKTLEENVEDLTAALGRAKANLELLADTRLEDRFGSLSGMVQGLARDLLALDEAAELKAMRGALDALLQQSLEPTITDVLTSNYGSRWQQETGNVAPLDLREQAYGKLTGGQGLDYKQFTERRTEIDTLAAAGDTEQVVSRVGALISDMLKGSEVGEVNTELAEMLTLLRDIAVKTAEVEAIRNGSAADNRRQRETDEIVAGLNRQAELSTAILIHGEDSAEVTATANRHAREALVQRMQERGVLATSVEAQRELAALAAAQAAEAALAEQSRARARADIMSGLGREAELSTAILTFGEASAEVEALRARHANDALAAKLEELGASPALIAQATALADQERARAATIRQNAATKRGGDLLADLQAEAAINQAILLYGEESLQVRQLQTAAERRAFEQQLESLDVSKELKEQLRGAWEAARGLAATDMAKAVSSARDYLRGQDERIGRLRLEQELLGQTEVTRTRLLALYDAEREIRNQGLDANSALAEQIRQNAVEEAVRTRELRRQADAWKEVEQTAGSAIDSIIDNLLKGDIPGALEAIAADVTGMFAELAIKNPLKNAILGGDLATMQDVGGLQGIIGRLLGRNDAAANLSASSKSYTTPQMLVTAASVMINGGAANINGVPGGTANINGALGTATPGGAAGTGWRNPVGLASHITLSEQEIIDLKKTVATEWVQSAGDAQGQGIIDTILNRKAAGKWGATVTDVVNATSQFSDINGRPAWQSGRNSVDDLPMSRIDARTDALVESWLRQRAGGAMSRVGDNLNYANPNYSDAKNLGWINGLTGPVLGAGNAIHRHGTTPDLQGYRPGDFGISLPGQGGAGIPGVETRLLPPIMALEKFGSTAELATGNLGQFGGGLDAFGQALSQMLTGGGGVPGGAAGGDGGLFGLIAKGIGGLFGIPGFRSGGATGGSDPSKVAGLVHEEEFVFDAAATRRIGVPALEAMRKGSLKGYRSGGYVTSGAAMRDAAGAAAQADTRPMVTIINNSSVPVVGEVQETTDAQGRRQSRLVLSDAIADAITVPGGKADKAMRGRYKGLKQAGINR